MSNKNTSLMVPQKIDPVAAYIDNMIATAKQWIDYGAFVLANNGDPKEVFEALGGICDSLVEIEKHNSLTAAVVPGLRAALDTALTQRDELAMKYEVVAATFDRQVKESVSEAVEHLFECEACNEDADVENLANRMLDEDPEEVVAEARQRLERHIEAAQGLAAEWRAEKPGEKPGIMSGETFSPNPHFKGSIYDQGEFDDDDNFDTDGDEPMGELTDGN